ncbi:MAG TPA: zinc ribbon domain-containing protein [Blastocatellia bacterium]|nr:zinc ribbon domain-containing protein [Blastocatellia bacterium]
MYCSSCGAAVKPGLSYCNHCGTELSAKRLSADARLSETSLQSLVWALASVTIIGLGAVIGLMAVMKEVLHLNDGPILFFTGLSFFIFMGVDSVFIWMLLRSKAGSNKAENVARRKVLSTRAIDETKARALPGPPLSVTEHTTRTLETADAEHRAD